MIFNSIYNIRPQIQIETAVNKHLSSSVMLNLKSRYDTEEFHLLFSVREKKEMKLSGLSTLPLVAADDGTDSRRYDPFH